MKRLATLAATAAVGFSALAARAADVPDFGPNVIILDPSSADAQGKIDTIYKTQEAGQFNERRYAVLLKPGHYDLDVKVGFYTQVLGLGRSPDDVDITGAVRSKATWMKGNATCNFWRGAENLAVTPTLENNVNVWAVSQATALRRVHVKGELHLWDGGWSSGGFLADSRVDGTVDSGSQQQWISRNSDWGRWKGGSWNMVFVGVPNAPAGEWPAKPYTTVSATPVIREKPYLTINSGGDYAVVVPGLRRDFSGTTWKPSKKNTKDATAQAVDSGDDRVLNLADFFIAHPGHDDASTINAQLDAGKHILLTPGIYNLAQPLRVTKANTVVLGLGFAELHAEAGTPAVTVADVDGVTLAGLLLDAGDVESPSLLQVGEPSATKSHAANPTALFDIFARAGGANVGRCKTFVTINSKDVIGDNFWLWRADHGRGAKWDQNTNANGLVVNGDNVTIYGLFVEHTQQYQTLWNGNGGRLYFYQSEFPYDPPSQAAWGNDGRGWASYKVADGVTTHEAHGLGVYCVFFGAPVVAQNAVEAPDAAGILMSNMVVAKFAGQPGSGTAHVFNGKGEDTINHKSARVE